MSNYAIGVKLVRFEKMTRGEYNGYRGWNLPDKENPDDPGYLVVYDHGYETWSPADVFEKFYLKLMDPYGTMIYEKDIDQFLFMQKSECLEDGRTTFVKATTLTDFVQYEVSTCVSPDNYNHQIGEKIAMDRIKNTIWKCLGFVLQWGINGFVNEPPKREPDF